MQGATSPSQRMKTARRLTNGQVCGAVCADGSQSRRIRPTGISRSKSASSFSFSTGAPGIIWLRLMQSTLYRSQNVLIFSNWSRFSGVMTKVRTLRRRLYAPHLHPRHTADAAKGRRENGQLHGADPISPTGKQSTGKEAISSPVLFGSFRAFRCTHGA